MVHEPIRRLLAVFVFGVGQWGLWEGQVQIRSAALIYLMRFKPNRQEHVGASVSCIPKADLALIGSLLQVHRALLFAGVYTPGTEMRERNKPK